MWEQVKSLIGDAAPLVGTLLGGPAGGAVGSMVASALGVQNTPEAIEHALVTDTEALYKLRKLESEHELELKRLAIEDGKLKVAEQQARLKDTQHAREQHKDHWMPSLLALLLCVMVTGMFAALFFGEPAQEYAQVLIMITGTVLGAFGTAIAFWLGSSKGSMDKGKQLKLQGG
ncbi:hypothetical protein [Photobacterium sp. TY1-4]|uniref:hypothetical protein n=1 Tax=Photobacterium sp. TY1-4 TaxID=2899122 RepID=UPI0021BFF0BD|nr:hypothetical protein [Photobacterium sp. TY1-4]UXI00431.1 hypothetical protein NH461_11475 [Photobacterium sp. TY1-4]